MLAICTNCTELEGIGETMANEGAGRKAEIVTEVGAEDARKVLGDILNRVGFGGERVVITRHGKPIATVVSCDEYDRLAKSAA